MRDRIKVFGEVQRRPCVASGRPVRPLLEGMLDSRIGGAFPLTKRLLAEREERGLETYGCVLSEFNGRDPVRDAAEEIADLLMYMEQSHLEEGSAYFDNGDMVETALMLERILRMMRSEGRAFREVGE